MIASSNSPICAQTIYVAAQIRQNTAAITASTHQAMIDYGRAQGEILITNPDVAQLVAKGETDPASLSTLEHDQFYEFTTWRMSMWELSFLNNKSGLMNEDSWKAFDGYFRLLTRKPGYAAFWNDTRPQWEIRFMEHVESRPVSK